jgi:predicted RNA binding protein YcfA (HicA-like mRNA interferase family)
MSRLPRLSAEKLIHIIKRLGFKEVRQSGSHKIFRNEAGKRITVPYHSGQVLHPKLINSVIRDLELTIEEFSKLA